MFTPSRITFFFKFIFGIGVIVLSGVLSAQCDCSAEQLSADSLQLVSFYEQMNGPAWTQQENWLTLAAIGSWEGVYLSEENCSVRFLDLDGRQQSDNSTNVFCPGPSVWPGHPDGINIRGPQWPEDIRLPCLRKLSIVNNSLNISIPDLSLFPELCEVYFEETGLEGSLNADLLALPDLSTLNLNSNNLTGNVPEELFVNAPNLSSLFLSNNELNQTVPDISDTNLEFLTLDSNRLTFEDLLPNFSSNIAALGGGFTYEPQKSIALPADTIAGLGLPFRLSPGVDQDVEGNQYVWTKDGIVIPGQTGNALEIDSLVMEDAGVYVLRWTNPSVPNLTLTTTPVRVSLCESGIRLIDESLCPGASFSEGDSPSFTEDTLYRLPVLSNNSCDSLWDIRLRILPPPVRIIDTIVCEGENIIFAGEVRSPGRETITIEETDVCGRQFTVELTVREATEAGLGAASIQNDSLSCGPNFRPIGNLPADTRGRWTVEPGVLVSSANDPLATLQLMEEVDNRVLWTLSAGSCQDYTVAEAFIYRPPQMAAVNDTQFIANDQSLSLEEEIDVLFNDTGLDNPNDVLVNIVQQPHFGSAEYRSDIQKLVYYRQPGVGLDSLLYSIEGIDCPPDTATVYLFRERVILPPDGPLPNVITPNGDGLNDVLIIPAIYHQPQDFPNAVLRIYNAKKRLLMTFTKYRNSWPGIDPAGQPLPGGNHYWYSIDYGNGRPSEWSKLAILYGWN